MSRAKNVTKVEQVSFHRNGIGGEPFHAVLFRTNASDMDMTANELMLGIVFDAPGACAVVAIKPLLDSAVGVRFGENSWRGDHFEDELRDAIKTHKSDGSTRMGPFGLPSAKALKKEVDRIRREQSRT